MNFLADHLTDPRDPDRVVHSLTSQMRTVILQRAPGWFDQSDTQVLAGDPLIASLAETGDLLGGLLREGNAGPAKDAATRIPHLVE